MTDSDDQDKTRIQARQPRPSAPGKTTPQSAGKIRTPDKTSAKAPGNLKPPADGTTQYVGPGTADVSAPPTPNRDTDRTLSLPPVLPEGSKPAALSSHDILKNRFVLERVLGAGGMGVVYKAKDLLKVEAKDRDPYVAIKVLGEEFKSHPEAFIALQRESRKTQRIAHPNIVTVYDFDKDGDTVFMTMEYLEGTPLDKLIKKYQKTGLPLPDAWRILEGICGALAYAHAQSIIHSDLKPGNIFVTDKSLAKVFDFGIARAVAKAEQDTPDADDRTIFDAGSFGALTPAYASLEMLEGDSPDVRDDIYALGCITYELLMGVHPFQRKNAKEARRAGMKAERIDCITKQQWRVVEQALAFERVNRIATVKEFWARLSQKQTHPGRFLSLVAAVLLAVAAIGFLYLNREQPAPVPTLTADDFRGEIETQIRMELLHQNIGELLRAATFDDRWENALWQEVQNLQQLGGVDHPEVQTTMAAAYAIYRERIQAQIEARKYDLALALIERGRRYADDESELNNFKDTVGSVLAEAERERQEKLAQQRLVEQRQQQERLEQQQEQQRQQEAARRQDSYEAALATVTQQLRCNQQLDMADFSIAVNKLRSLDAAKYQQSESKIVADLVACVEKIGRNFPDRATAARATAVDLFPQNAKIRGIQIAEHDACSASLAGLGARGKRSVCQDALSGGVKSPQTVVILGKGDQPTFAIGRYEVTVAEINQYCRSSEACQPLPANNQDLPAVGIPVQLAQAYLSWLSSESGKTYRLPTLAEWQLAARANGRGVDANRNCMLNSRGIQKGGSLLNAEIGQQNSWGLVNYLGNAQEWVVGPGDRLLVVGGSYATDMSDCTIEWQKSSGGQADAETGFRVVRELVQG